MNLILFQIIFDILNRQSKGIQKIGQRHLFTRKFHGAGPPRPSTAHETNTCPNSPALAFRASR